MDQWWLNAVNHVAGQWGAGLLAVGWLLHRLGIFQFFHRALGAEQAERQRLAKDQLAMIERLQAETVDLRAMVDDLRRWRREDKAASAEAVAQMRAECDEELAKLRSQIDLLVKGEARWRHLVGNLAQYIDALRTKLRDSGINVVPFDGWRRFIEDGGELPEKILAVETPS